MGAWGDDTFENDSAMDWVANVTQGDLSFVAETLRDGLRSERGPRPDWEAHMAAMEVVATLRGHRPEKIGASLLVWCEGKPRLDDASEALALQLAVALESNESFLELFGQPTPTGPAYPPLAGIIERLRVEPQPMVPVTDAERKEHEELQEVLARGWDNFAGTDLGDEIGLGGTVLPRSGDTIGVPLDGTRLALCVLFDASVGPQWRSGSGDDPAPSDGLIAVTDRVVDSRDLPEGCLVDGAKIIAVNRFMLGLVQVGKWPVLASGYSKGDLAGNSADSMSAELHRLAESDGNCKGPSVLERFVRAWHRVGPCNHYEGGPQSLGSVGAFDSDSVPDDLLFD